MNSHKFGRGLLIFMNIATALNGLVADWNRTHLYNPNWPPHAKFHDGMTISFGLLLGVFGLCALFRKEWSEVSRVRFATLPPLLFFVTMISAAAYPGAGSIETEFPGYWPKIGSFSFNEVPFAITMLLLTVVSWRLAERPPEVVGANVLTPRGEARGQAQGS